MWGKDKDIEISIKSCNDLLSLLGRLHWNRNGRRFWASFVYHTENSNYTEPPQKNSGIPHEAFFSGLLEELF